MKIPAHILPLARAAAAKVWRDADGHNEARRIEAGENDGFAVKVAAAAIQMNEESLTNAADCERARIVAYCKLAGYPDIAHDIEAGKL